MGFPTVPSASFVAAVDAEYKVACRLLGNRVAFEQAFRDLVIERLAYHKAARKDLIFWMELNGRTLNGMTNEVGGPRHALLQLPNNVIMEVPDGRLITSTINFRRCASYLWDSAICVELLSIFAASNPKEILSCTITRAKAGEDRWVIADELDWSVPLL